MADAIPTLLDPFRTGELAEHVGANRVTVSAWKNGRALPGAGFHHPLALALAALRGGSTDDAVAIAKARMEVDAAYRADLADRSRAARTAP
jgi:hypothetical protein